MPICSRCGYSGGEKRFHKKSIQTECYKCSRKRKTTMDAGLFKMKSVAQELSRVAIRLHYLVRKPCIICGDEKVYGHHEDYSKPLEIIWLCKKHHTEMHKNKPFLSFFPKII